MEKKSFTQIIRSKEVAAELLDMGFEIVNTSTETGWTLKAPSSFSNSKARKIISNTINFCIAAKELNRAQARYNRFAQRIDQIISKR